MQSNDIIDALSSLSNGLPKEAMTAAIKQWDEVSPELLKALSFPPDLLENEQSDLIFLAMYLVGEAREKAAFPLLINYFSSPGDDAVDSMGDLVTEGLDRILASTFDGNLPLLKSLIDNRNLNVYCRLAGLNAAIILMLEGELNRAEVIDYFRALTHADGEDLVFNSSLICSCQEAGLNELAEDVRSIADRRAYDPGYVDACELAKEMLATDNFEPNRNGYGAKFTLIGKAVDELKNWASFSEATPTSLEREEMIRQYSQLHTVARKTPKIGRNDPCPCGSGKKFKKCCLNKQ